MAEGYEPKPIADLKSVTYSGTTIYNGGYNLYSEVGISVSRWVSIMSTTSDYIPFSAGNGWVLVYYNNNGTLEPAINKSVSGILYYI